WKRSKLPVADRPGLRPTPDRVRETLFNWLGQQLDGEVTLELYAGTGVLSLEALSRGAGHAVAIDRNPGLVRALAATAKSFGVTGLEARTGDAGAWLEQETRRFDVIFLDPPFAQDPWDWLLPASAALLNPNGRVYAECGRTLVAPPTLRMLRHGRAGQVHYHLFALSA
ncbi:MAG TPA: RsmD family RNA methyltransferase, partial [Casimicrobiaceae bacterium]|nr:RsmD family RNA methyltransferase [Casimicrobiaceae bacterium]